MTEDDAKRLAEIRKGTDFRKRYERQPERRPGAERGRDPSCLEGVLGDARE